MPSLSFRAENGVGAIATSPSGRDVALASRSGLYIVDLQEPYSPPRLLSLRTPWEVSSVQWCSHPNHYNRVVSTASQKLVVWNLMLPSHNAVEHVLHGHSRAITDVSFSRLSPDLLATCSIDTYVHIWDMRDPLRPSMSFADFEAGASQVKWSKTQPHLLASAHQNRLLLWDSRKQNIPLIEIAAHSRRINSIDFDDTSNNNLATASIDRSIKVWNLNDLKRGGEQTPRLIMRARFPVWRTRYLPDGGNGAFVIPLRGSNNNAYLADLSPRHEEVPFEPVQTFSAHKAPIKDLSLRREGHGYNLLTWGGDATLNMWGVDESSLNAVNVPTTTMPILPRDYTYRHNPETSDSQPHHLPVRSGFFRMANENDDPLETNDDRHINWIAGVQVNGSVDSNRMEPQFAPGGGGPSYTGTLNNPKSSNLSSEITAVSAKFPKVHFELIDIANGKCVFTARGPWGRDDDEVVTLRVHTRFPHDYPHAPLECVVEEDPNSDPTKIAEMEQYLSESTATIAEHGKHALEFCLRYLMGDGMPIETIIFEPLDPMDPMDPMDYFEDSYNSTDSEYGIGNGEETPSRKVEDDTDDIERNPDNIFTEGIFKPKIDSTPLPRTCSAVWSTTGQLVMFVNTQKENNTAPDLYALGRVLPGEDDSDSESSISSFESEGELEQGRFKNHRFPRGFQVRPWTVKTVKSVVSSEDTESAVSSEIIQILNYNSLLPCRPDMAAEYRYDFKLDNIQDLIDHNAQVAERYGKHEDAYIWRLSRYHSSKNFAQPLQKEMAANVGGNEALLPFFNFYASKFHSSLIDALVEYLKAQGNYMLLVGIDCINCVRYGDQMEQLTRTFYYNSGRPSSFVTYFESQHNFAHPRAISASPPPDLRPRNKRRADRNKTETQKYLPLSVVHTTAGVFDSKISSSLAKPTYRRSHHSSASVRRVSKPASDFSSNATDDGNEPALKIKVEYLNPILSNAEFNVESNNGYPNLMSRYTSNVDDMMKRRQLYTSMLDAWGLSIKRLEILNIPLPVSEFETAMDNETDDEWMIGIKLAGKKSNTKSQSMCVYCLQLLSTQLVTCLRCNHVYHRKCLQTWSEVSNECATGCGCVCMPTKS